MARTAITPPQRAAKIVTASRELPAAVQTALDISADKGYGHADALAAWEIVEELGATAHRQGRLLAGKNRGG